MSNPVPPVARIAEATLVAGLGSLRTELVELAYAMDRRGQPEAADVALWAAGRLAEMGGPPQARRCCGPEPAGSSGECYSETASPDDLEPGTTDDLLTGLPGS